MSSIQGEMEIFHDENRLMKFQGKHVQEDVGYDDKNENEKVHGKRSKFDKVSSDKILVESPKSPGFWDLYPRIDEGHVYEDAGCHCDESYNPVFIDHEDLTLIPGMVVPPFLMDFARDMTAKSDDKTVLATHLSPELKSDSHLLEIFKSIGDVRRANLAIDPKSGLSWGFGFVTFVTKEDAQKAIQELNGLDKCIHES